MQTKKLLKRSTIMALFIIFCFSFFKVQAVTLKASVVKMDITPEVPVWLSGYGLKWRPTPGEIIHDNLSMRTLCLDDGSTQIFLVSSDIISFSVSHFEKFCKKLSKKTGIKPEQVLWTTVHTHEGPAIGKEKNKKYNDWLIDMVIKSIKQARSSIVPARLGYVSSIALANMNRRAIYPARDYNEANLGKNPKKAMDRQLGIIKIERDDGTLMALIANYAMHGTTMGPHNFVISGDAQGIVEFYVEKKLGVPVLYVNGACGNLDPLYAYRRAFIEDNHFNIYYFEKILGDPILLAQKMVITTPDVCLKTESAVIKIPRGSQENNRTKKEKKIIDVPVRFLVINDLMIFCAPLELFCEIAMNIKDNSPFNETFYFGYTNGCMGYLPTKKAFSIGGYEVAWASPFDTRAEKIFYDRIAGEIKKIYNELKSDKEIDI